MTETTAPTPDDLAQLHRELIKAAAARALHSAGCKHPRVLMAHVEPRLTCIDPGEGDPLRIVGVDDAGRRRNGPRGPMSADDVVRKILRDPEFAYAAGLTDSKRWKRP